MPDDGRSTRMRLIASVRLAAVAATALVGLPERTGGSALVGPTSARGDDIDWGLDSDADGLPDEVERLIKTSCSLEDSDGDGFNDSTEWILKSDPRDAASMPDPQPGLRACAYEADGQLRVFCAVFPANLDMIDSFHMMIGSREFDYAVEGDPGTGIGLYDVSGLLGTMAHDFTESSFLGLQIIGFAFDLDRSLLVNDGPLNVGWGATLAGVKVTDQLYLATQGGSNYVLAGGPTMPGGAASFVINPMSPVPPPAEEVPEYCEVGFGEGTAVGLASVEYTVTSAGCEPDGLLFCIDADCDALGGQTFTLVDYGYLQDKADD